MDTFHFAEVCPSWDRADPDSMIDLIGQVSSACRPVAEGGAVLLVAFPVEPTSSLDMSCIDMSVIIKDISFYDPVVYVMKHDANPHEPGSVGQDVFVSCKEIFKSDWVLKTYYRLFRSHQEVIDDDEFNRAVYVALRRNLPPA